MKHAAVPGLAIALACVFGSLDPGARAGEPEARVPFENAPDAELEAAILRATPEYTRATVDLDGRKARYVHGRVDLDGDGTDEVLVYLLGSVFCGTGGCDLVLLDDADHGHAPIQTFPISQLPVIVSPTRTAGWHDLVRLESGGGAEPAYVRHAFDGAKYVERERLPADVAPKGTWYLAGELTFEDGVILEPRD